MSEINLSLKYSDWQREIFFKNKARFTTIEKGRRVGFTKGIANACIEWLLEGKKILWVDTINTNLKRYYERYFLPELKKLPPSMWKFNYQDKQLNINGAWLDMRSAEIPQNIEGFGYDIVILNEAGIILKNSYLWDNAIRPMLLDYPTSRAFIGGVPKGKNRFYDLAMRGMRNEKDWVNYQISSFENPLLRKDEIDELIAELGGAESDVVRQEIYGEFLDTTTNALFTLAMIERAFGAPHIHEPQGVIVWGLDVAREGDDESVLCKRAGNHIEEMKEYRVNSVTELARVVMGEYERSETKPDAIFIDTVGIGAGTYDTLCDLGLSGIVREAKASFKASDERKYPNKRAEMFFTLRDKFHLLSIPANEKLKKQLQMIEYIYDKKDRYAILPKETIKKEFGVSPDLADALALTYFDPVLPKIITSRADEYDSGW
ncbi:hypothetical protein CCAL6883_08350 [Campylobacter sp. RM6883]|uniref:terminase large subunit domain-containing protein n=1 Tax=Campylobacter californiensis TaxID=1032243 RepID=UPI001451C387|nr:terminase family protein [Campylobacter sp. RM6914]MBE2985346.1 hypothetical protein [Campylobacter sp. RM6883]MBE2995879.1 hypothetical protein [Campylobacter sp. RM6913]QCD51231.1 terminase domain protein [Campylobacter sp. RM6914]